MSKYVKLTKGEGEEDGEDGGSKKNKKVKTVEMEVNGDDDVDGK